jgi:predicted Zn-dependent protease
MALPIRIENPYPTFDPEAALRLIAAEGDWVGLRYVVEISHRRRARNGRPDHNSIGFEQGVMIESMVDGHIAYSATSDLSTEGLRKAARKARHLAALTAKMKVATFDAPSVRPVTLGAYRSPFHQGLDQLSLEAFTQGLIQSTQALKVSNEIVNALAEATLTETSMTYVSTNGADIHQNWLLIGQNFQAVAAREGEVQQRSLNGPTARCWQSGLESFDFDRLSLECQRVGEEAIQLLEAENCPEARCDLILAPDQMLLQIHESIGHPLELDRILGDERNYAGWSFVQPQDFGHLQYGSQLMNVTYDPELSGGFASFGFDDAGATARREFLIREGKLLRGLGGLESQSRIGQPGVANFRSSSWNRAPIDRMGNINLEPGDSCLEEMIRNTQHGVLMASNRSWSIDDYRNKFQFGCEWGQLIEEGQLTRVVKNPNYRGITIPFWSSLCEVGGRNEFAAFGTPYCGKGEPNQMIRVGHAAPPCRFRDIEVFGGGQS